jgi:hypothetical protein
MQQASAPLSLFEKLETRVLFTGATDMVVHWNEHDDRRASRRSTKPGRAGRAARWR